MRPEELCKIAQSLRLPKTELCNLSIKPDPIQEQAELIKRILAFTPAQGWLCFQSKVCCFSTHQKLLEILTDSQYGYLLYGEFFSNHISVHIRETGNGGWIWTAFEEVPGSKYLVETKPLLGIGEKNQSPDKLKYRVYWKHEPGQGYRQYAARFNGFSQENQP